MGDIIKQYREEIETALEIMLENENKHTAPDTLQDAPNVEEEAPVPDAGTEIDDIQLDEGLISGRRFASLLKKFREEIEGITDPNEVVTIAKMYLRESLVKKNDEFRKKLLKLAQETITYLKMKEKPASENIAQQMKKKAVGESLEIGESEENMDEGKIGDSAKGVAKSAWEGAKERGKKALETAGNIGGKTLSGAKIGYKHAMFQRNVKKMTNIFNKQAEKYVDKLLPKLIMSQGGINTLKQNEVERQNYINRYKEALIDLTLSIKNELDNTMDAEKS